MVRRPPPPLRDASSKHGRQTVATTAVPAWVTQGPAKPITAAYTGGTPPPRAARSPRLGGTEGIACVVGAGKIFAACDANDNKPKNSPRPPRARQAGWQSAPDGSRRLQPRTAPASEHWHRRDSTARIADAHRRDRRALSAPTTLATPRPRIHPIWPGECSSWRRPALLAAVAGDYSKNRSGLASMRRSGACWR